VHGSCRDEPVVILASQGHRPVLTAVPHRGTAAGADRRRVAMTETGLATSGRGTRPALPGPGHPPVGGPTDRPEPNLIPAARTSALTSYFVVELPGIETAGEIHSTCGDAGFDYAKRRESTANDLRIRDRR
jgi:hypothetical protein